VGVLLPSHLGVEIHPCLEIQGETFLVALAYHGLVHQQVQGEVVYDAVETLAAEVEALPRPILVVAVDRDLEVDAAESASAEESVTGCLDLVVAETANHAERNRHQRILGELLVAVGAEMRCDRVALVEFPARGRSFVANDGLVVAELAVCAS